MNKVKCHHLCSLQSDNHLISQTLNKNWKTKLSKLIFMIVTHCYFPKSKPATWTGAGSACISRHRCRGAPSSLGFLGGSAGSGAGGQGGALGARWPRSAPGSATRGLSGLGKLLSPSVPTGSSQRPPTTLWWAAHEFVWSTEKRSGHRREPLRTGGHRTSSSPLKTKTNSALSAQPRSVGGHSDKATLPALPGWSLQVLAVCGGRPPARAEGRAPRTCWVPCLGSVLPLLTEAPHPSGLSTN